MAQEKDTSGDINFDSQNIFDEFSESQDIGEEVKEIEKKQEKDIYYYLKKLNSVFFSLNVLLFLGILIIISYLYIQSGEENRNYDVLTPICSVFLWRSDIDVWTCKSVGYGLVKYRELLQWEKQQQTKKILPLLWEVYSIENFNLSKKVSFLLEKTESRLKPLDIISAFDAMKAEFAPVDKNEISCSEINIQAGGILSIECSIYSSDWDTWIADFKDGTREYIIWWGTSVSRASSFIYFLENHQKSPFTILEKPESLSSEAARLSPYTQKTVIQLILQYSSTSQLSY